MVFCAIPTNLPHQLVISRYVMTYFKYPALQCRCFVSSLFTFICSDCVANTITANTIYTHILDYTYTDFSFMTDNKTPTV